MAHSNVGRDRQNWREIEKRQIDFGDGVISTGRKRASNRFKGGGTGADGSGPKRIIDLREKTALIKMELVKRCILVIICHVGIIFISGLQHCVTIFEVCTIEGRFEVCSDTDRSGCQNDERVAVGSASARRIIFETDVICNIIVQNDRQVRLLTFLNRYSTEIDFF